MLVNRAFKFRIYPNKDQAQELENQLGACRFVYNYFLRRRIDYYAANKKNTKNKKGLTYFDTTAELTQLKKSKEYEWLKEVNAQSLQQSLRYLDVAYNNFFNKRSKFPNFKSKRSRQAFRVPQNFCIDNAHLLIPKLTPINIVLHRPIDGTVKSITISKTSSGRYFVSFSCEVDIKSNQRKGREIGIDLGVKTFAVTSDKEKIETPSFFKKSEIKLAELQRALAKKKKGSNGYEKARIKLAKVHEHIANQRSDFLHKTSRRLIDESQAIFVEDLSVKEMIENGRHKGLAKSISDASWSEFLRQLEYKGEWYGCTVFKIDKFFPSSKRCRNCGHVNQDLKLSDRSWTCPECGKKLNRDFNAACNILLFGKKCRAGTARTYHAGEDLNR